MTFLNKIKGFFKKKENIEENEYVEVKEESSPAVKPTLQEAKEPNVVKKPVKSNEEIEKELREFYKNRKERNQFR